MESCPAFRCPTPDGRCLFSTGYVLGLTDCYSEGHICAGPLGDAVRGECVPGGRVGIPSLPLWAASGAAQPLAKVRTAAGVALMSSYFPRAQTSQSTLAFLQHTSTPRAAWSEEGQHRATCITCSLQELFPLPEAPSRCQ